MDWHPVIKLTTAMLAIISLARLAPMFLRLVWFRLICFITVLRNSTQLACRKWVITVNNPLGLISFTINAIQ
jgi:hypothetical protein